MNFTSNVRQDRRRRGRRRSTSSDLIAGPAGADAGRATSRKSKFKGLADIVLAEAKRQGCSYADVRFTMTASLPGGSANFTTAAARRRRR